MAEVPAGVGTTMATCIDRDDPTENAKREKNGTLDRVIFCLIRDSGQTSKAEPLVVVRTTWALEALVPSKVTDDGATVQEALWANLNN